MTSLQKQIVSKLLQGYNIAASGSSGFRLRDPQQHVEMKFTTPTFQSIRKYLRRNKDVFVINKSLVRQMHGKSFIKREYKSLRKNQQISEVGV